MTLREPWGHSSRFREALESVCYRGARRQVWRNSMGSGRSVCGVGWLRETRCPTEATNSYDSLTVLRDFVIGRVYLTKVDLVARFDER